MASFSIGQDIEVRIDPGPKIQETVLDDQGVYLWNDSGNMRVFLPATEYPTDPQQRKEMLQKLLERKPLTVRVVEQGGTDKTWIVSYARIFSQSPWLEEIQQWTPGQTIKSMRVTSVHADLVYGEIRPEVLSISV